jgi:sugar phosphate isomerase/epimerase
MHLTAKRLGLNVPIDWWASPAVLKSFEASGFGRVQIHAPPARVLSDARLCARHAAALAEGLATTALEPVVHAPRDLTLGTRGGDLAGEGLLSYAAEVGATHVVYHACARPDLPDNQDALLFEARSLAARARRAELLGVTIAIENLAPVFPGREVLSAHPMTLRSLARRIGSDRVGVCLDVGHAHIVADLRRTSLEALIEPVLDVVTLFHVHDNFGARWRATGAEAGVDPLKLDLHLPPGRGRVDWQRLAPRLVRHHAPLVLEVHPAYRPSAEDLHRSFTELLGQRDEALAAT